MHATSVLCAFVWQHLTIKLIVIHGATQCSSSTNGLLLSTPAVKRIRGVGLEDYGIPTSAGSGNAEFLLTNIRDSSRAAFRCAAESNLVVTDAGRSFPS